ncbi:hypothetical protein [Microbispora sp. CA-102843]
MGTVHRLSSQAESPSLRTKAIDSPHMAAAVQGMFTPPGTAA